MYSKRIESFLKRKKLKIGDMVTVTKEGRKISGLLMPQTVSGNPDILVIKLVDNGYNIGVKMEAGAAVEKGKGTEPVLVEEEAEFELGKTKTSGKLKFSAGKPKISLISTGGTISSRVDYRTGGVYAVKDPGEFLYNIPELAKAVNIRKLVTPFTKMSEDMEPQDWKQIARAVARELNSGDRGVIVTHGTDFLHYTAAALSFFLRGLTKPVVLVGAQRSSDRGSSDAGMNLLCAAHTAVSDIAEVGVCMHGRIDDDYCLFTRGTHVRKMDTQRRDAFRPINEYPLAKVWPDGKIMVKNRKHKKRDDNGKVKPDLKFEPKVAMLKTYPGSDPDVINYYISRGFRGFVIEGSGLGHVPVQAKKNWTSIIKKHTKDGVPFVITPQTIYGRINTSVYTNLRILYKETGAIPGGDMLSEVALVKLGWALGHTKDPEKVREIMLTNYAEEITSRTLVGTFLY